MNLERIMQLMPVPPDAVERKGHDWPRLESRLGLLLPQDYKEILAAYGTGAIGGFLWVLNPFSVNPSLNEGAIGYLRQAYAQMKAAFPADYPRAVSEFLPWAVTDNGDSLVWTISGNDPERWCVAIHNHDQGAEEVSALNASGFLAALLEKEVVSSILPRDFLMADKSFEPLRLDAGSA